jgi:dTDP-4-amino-4,6-dideoxygalactose transaminase
VTLGWNCRPTEYQAALLLHRLRKFDRQQAVRARNFARLRELLVDSRALTPLAVHPNVDAHAMYMFVMRYRAEHCGGLGIDEFLRIVRAEGVPLHRGFAATISQQPAIRDLATRRADYVRVLETPVADRAARETLYVSHEVFLGGDRDMEDIAAAIRKVERRFSTAGRAS